MIEKRLNTHGDFSLFATQFLPEGTLLFSYQEWIEDEQFGWEILSLEDLEKLSPEEKEIFLRYGYDRDFGKVIGTFDWENARNHSNFMNHSCEPNMFYDFEDNIIAKRDIHPGEELTIDYANFIINVDQHFDCRCGSTQCRGKITKDDWKNLVPSYGYHFPRFIHRAIDEFLLQQKVPA